MQPVATFKDAILAQVPKIEGKGNNHRYRLYLETNEKKTQVTLAQLATHTLSGSVMIGTSGFFSLDAFAMRAVSSKQPLNYLVVVDISVHTGLFWRHLENIVLKSKDRIEAMSEIGKDFYDNVEAYLPIDDLKPRGIDRKVLIEQTQYYYREAMMAETTWLSFEDRFQVIKKLFVEKRFAFVLGDLTDPTLTRSIAQVLQGRKLTVGALYLSNIREFVEELTKNMAAYRDALTELKSVMTDESVVIDTEPRPGGFTVATTGATQRVFKKFVSEKTEVTVPFSPGITE